MYKDEWDIGRMDSTSSPTKVIQKPHKIGSYYIASPDAYSESPPSSPPNNEISISLT